jgi:hypothetical protein
MQADVQRNVNQQQRIEQGVQSGQLTTCEVGNLVKGQAKGDRKEARDGANGHISATEQHNIRSAEKHQSHRFSGRTTTVLRRTRKNARFGGRSLIASRYPAQVAP